MASPLEQIAVTLSNSPGTLIALLKQLPEELLHATEGPDTFSPFDVVGHLIDGEETDWMVRARIIRAQEDDAAFAPYDRFRHRKRNSGRSIDALLTEFAELRAANLAELNSWSLTSDDLHLTGVHPSFGPVTLEELLAAWVVHDLGHIAQIARVMAKRYRNQVGPWRRFLPVLDDRPKPVS